MFKLLKRNIGFRNLMLSSFISDLGAWFSYMLLIVLAFEASGSIMQTMWVVGAEAVAMLVGGAVAGVIIEDKLPSKVISVSNILSAFIIGLLFFIPANPWIYVCAAFLNTLVVSFRIPAYNKFMVAAVDEEDLIHSNAGIQMIQGVIKIIGPGLAAFVLGVLPEAHQNVGFLIDSSTYIVAATFMFMSTKYIEFTHEDKQQEAKEKYTFKKRWIEGIQPFKKPIIINVFMLYVFVMFGIAGFDVLMTAHISESGYGTLMIGYTAGSLSGGMILMSMLGSKWVKKLPLFIQLGGSITGFGLFFTCIGWSENIIAMIASSFLVGIFFATFMMSASTFWQTTVPYEQLGRFMSVGRSLLSVATLSGMTLNGFVAGLTSGGFVIFWCGLLITVAGSVSLLTIHRRRESDSSSDPKVSTQNA